MPQLTVWEAVLSHKMADGTERPIAYASCTLIASERNYSQLEKEGLACIFGINKFQIMCLSVPLSW